MSMSCIPMGFYRRIWPHGLGLTPMIYGVAISAWEERKWSRLNDANGVG